MSDYLDARAAGVAAYQAGKMASVNPYAVDLSAIDIALDRQPPVRDQVLAAQWLAGWRSAVPTNLGGVS